MRKTRPKEGKGMALGDPMGSSTLSPVPLCLPLPSLKTASRGRLPSWRKRAFVTQRGEPWAGGSQDRKQSRGRKEVRKRRTGP